jgi:multimeric flavodoxin WrbA
MPKNILIISGSPKKDGNTAALVGWFAEGARSKGAKVEVADVGRMQFKVAGCSACRSCQKLPFYECVINDEGKQVLARMLEADVIVMATPLYFYGPSTQLKVIIDRMFSLFKWDNGAGTMETPLKGKTFGLILSAFEDVGLDLVEKSFFITAEYAGMKFSSLLVPNVGVSGDVLNKPGIREQAGMFGEKLAGASC